MQVKDEKIIINGKETIIFGAELHYFRIPKEDWQSRIRQAKEAGMNMISTYVPWIFHEYEEGAIDLTGETRDERDFQSFLQMVGEEGLYCLVRPGPYVMAEIVDHGVPTWFIENYPEALAQTENGEPHPTRVVSYMHPEYLRKVEQWYAAVCAVIQPFQLDQGGPVIMFQLDNEVGMFHWVTNTGDFNTVTKKHFIEYLENKSQTDGDPWADPFSFLDEERKSEKSTALKNEYYFFMRDHYRRYLEYLKELAAKEGITVPYIINIHGFHTIDYLKRGTRYPIGVSQLLDAAKMENTLVAGDYYIGNIEYDNFVDVVLANAFTKSIQSPDQPLFSAEFQGGSASDKPRLQPSTFDLTTRLCFANGMNAVNYYMFVGGENYEAIGLNGRRHEWQAPLSAAGEKKPHFHIIQHLGKMFRTFEKPLLQAKQDVQTCLAFYPDYYMTDYSRPSSLLNFETFQYQRDTNLYNGLAKALRINHIVFDSVNIQDSAPLEVEKTPVLWMFSMKWMDRHVQQKLVDYAESGGKLVLFPNIPEKDLNGRDCTLLKDRIGVDPNGKKGGFATIGDIDSVQTRSMEMFDVREGAFAWSEDDEKDVVAFEKEMGKGKVVVFGVEMDIDFYYKNDVIRDLAERVNVRTDYTLDQELDVSVRSISEESYFVFLHNFDEYRKSTAIEVRGEPLCEGKAITVPPKSGLMLPVNIPLTDHLVVCYGTAEIYEVQTDSDELRMRVKLKQAEETFEFESDQWRPLEADGIEVEQVNKRQYRVTLLPSLKEEITVGFVGAA